MIDLFIKVQYVGIRWAILLSQDPASRLRLPCCSVSSLLLQVMMLMRGWWMMMSVLSVFVCQCFCVWECFVLCTFSLQTLVSHRGNVKYHLSQDRSGSWISKGQLLFRKALRKSGRSPVDFPGFLMAFLLIWRKRKTKVVKIVRFKTFRKERQLGISLNSSTRVSFFLSFNPFWSGPFIAKVLTLCDTAVTCWTCSPSKPCIILMDY